MTDKQCNHAHGDHIKEIHSWVCGKCYDKLNTRPQRLGMVSYGNVTRQEITWQAAISKASNGMTLRLFLNAVARRFRHFSGEMSNEDALDMAIEAMKGMGEEFGNQSCDWSRASAIDLADEEIHYWDIEGEGGN